MTVLFQLPLRILKAILVHNDRYGRHTDIEYLKRKNQYAV